MFQGAVWVRALSLGSLPGPWVCDAGLSHKSLQSFSHAHDVLRLLISCVAGRMCHVYPCITMSGRKQRDRRGVQWNC